MFESLTDSLSKSLRNLAGKGKLSESNIKEAMEEVRTSLLEADVNYDIVSEFIDEVIATSLGEEVLKKLKKGDAWQLAAASFKTWKVDLELMATK